MEGVIYRLAERFGRAVHFGAVVCQGDEVALMNCLLLHSHEERPTVDCKGEV